MSYHYRDSNNHYITTTITIITIVVLGALYLYFVFTNDPELQAQEETTRECFVNNKIVHKEKYYIITDNCGHLTTNGNLYDKIMINKSYNFTIAGRDNFIITQDISKINE